MISQKTVPLKPNPAALSFFNIAVLSGFLLVLFFLLTNGIPLSEWGILKSFPSKGMCMKRMRAAILIFAAALLFLRYKMPLIFEKLWLVRFLREKLSSQFLIGLSTILFVLYTCLFIREGFMRHAALQTRAFDLGIFAQAIWNTTQGNFLFSSLKDGICLLGDHMSPVLLALVPIYKIWPDPRVLLMVQAIASASSIFLVTRIAKKVTANHFIALVFCLAYFFYSPTRSALKEDFHPEVLVEPFIFLAFIFLEAKRPIAFILSLLVLITGKENMLGISFMFGFYAFLYNRWKGIGLFTMAGSLILFYLNVHTFIPALSGKPYLYQGFYLHLFQRPPLQVLRFIFGLETWGYLFKVFFPFLFLPFFHLGSLMSGLPILVQNILSDNPVFRSFGYHYMTGLTPFLFISSIYGFDVLCKKFSWAANQKALLASIFLCLSLLRSGPSEYFYMTEISKAITPERQTIRHELQRIPAGVSILTHNNVIPQVINHQYIYQFDYNSAETKSEIALKRQIDYVILAQDFWEPGTLPFDQTFNELKNAGYAVDFESPQFVILKKSKTAQEMAS